MNLKIPIIFLTFANDKVDDALYLRNLPKELHGIRTALEKAEKAGLCEIIERAACTIDYIFDIFQDPRYKDRIAVFHYGGHASGNQLMLETLDGNKETSHSDGLIPFLGKQKSLKLAFFNGCSSQEQALELVDAGVPAVIGTAKAIKDEVARELASRFYNGLAAGHSLHQAWLEAIDILKTRTNTKKRKGLKLRRDKATDFPWALYVRDGSEIVKEWNLPDASENPLFGLPSLPKIDLPEEPFRFLRRYEASHAEIFFGRDQYIHQLYERITSELSAPVILFYGQSGAGKSSTLDAGLLPRLKQETEVVYKRRHPEIGLLGSLDEALGGNFQSEIVRDEQGNAILVSDIRRQLDTIKELMVSMRLERQSALKVIADELEQKLTEQNVHLSIEAIQTRLERWLAIEAERGRPFHILLDQVEETYTRYNADLGNELELFLVEVQQIFEDPSHRPQGKIILSYRKEYHPEIDEFCKKLEIPRESVFLKKLERKDIIRVIKGIESSERLLRKYTIRIEEKLPVIIADDLLEDRDSPIAPVLSILLTKLYNLAKAENSPYIKIEQYQNLRKEGLLMEDFFHQQMEKLLDWQPNIYESGLALDILNFHTTNLGTAASQTIETLRARYKHQGSLIDEIIEEFKALYLLTNVGKGQTALAHDTLAPIVSKEIRKSDKSGQRALRVLTSKIPEFSQDKTNVLDVEDLSLVEAGKDGMRLWSEKERELIQLSVEKRERKRRRRRNGRRVTAVFIAVIVGLGFFSILTLIGRMNAEATEKINQLEAIEVRIKTVIRGEGCINDLLCEMNAPINDFENNSFLNRFIDRGKKDTIISYKNKYIEEFQLYEQKADECILGKNAEKKTGSL